MNHKQTLVQMFRTHVALNPHAPLLHYLDATYSYQQCDDISDSIVVLLQNHGVQKNDAVCIANHKSVYGYASMLACLKLGVAYCNCDYANAPQRLEHIIKTCDPKLLLQDGDAPIWDELAAKCGVRNLKLDENLVSAKPVELSDPSENTCAYIMFTSGSTGTPKGVMISHDNVAQFVEWIKDRFGVSCADRFSQVNPLYFDNSVFDFYGAIFNGASLIPVDVSKVAPHEPLMLLAKLNCTRLFTVPSMIMYWQRLRCFDSIALPALKQIIFGGEAFPKSALHPLFLQLPAVEFISVYGPTECTCICSSYTVTQNDFNDLNSYLPLGPLNPGFLGKIIEGELVLLGDNVGMGYRHDFANTSKSWRSGYHTGDLVECVGSIYYFKGRIDNQIKHMGYRIELEEIEAVLMTLRGVSQAIVTYHKQEPVGGEFTAHLQGDATFEAEIQRELIQRLPSYMRPHHLIWHQQLPKNANGKVCRKQIVSQRLLENSQNRVLSNR